MTTVPVYHLYSRERGDCGVIAALGTWIDGRTFSGLLRIREGASSSADGPSPAMEYAVERCLRDFEKAGAVPMQIIVLHDLGHATAATLYAGEAEDVITRLTDGGTAGREFQTSFTANPGGPRIIRPYQDVSYEIAPPVLPVRVRRSR